jgi:hypothetical protein
VGRIENDKLNAFRARNHLGGKRRAAHSAQHDSVQPSGAKFVTKFDDLIDEWPGM